MNASKILTVINVSLTIFLILSCITIFLFGWGLGMQVHKIVTGFSLGVIAVVLPAVLMI